MTAPHSSTPHSSGHASKGNLWTGSILSILLTVIPFALVMSGAFGAGAGVTVAIFLCAMVQIVVHVYYFLHVNRQAENGWTLLAFLFTAIIVIITIFGTIWVMYHLNANMMPMRMDG